METNRTENPASSQPKWRKVAYGGMQPGFDDNHIDDSFLAEMVMNANVVKRSMLKVMLDSVSISQYLCVVALVVLVWTYTLQSTISENFLLLLDVSVLGLGSTVKALGALENPSFTSNISLNASIVASLLIASRLPSRLHVFAIVFFSVQIFLFVPLVTYCIKKYSFRIQEYKFEINGPWDEARLCFDITE
ncbi:hypothetical protein AgCh_020668 [Apium graveolens]